MSTPFVSVIIPTFNVENHIADCLERVFLSRGVSLEVIVVDNNSTDGTRNVLNDLRKTYDFSLEDEKKQGGSAARNRGLSLAKADWVQFLDADDLLLPDKLIHQAGLVRDESLVVSLVVGSFIQRSAEGSERVVYSGSGEPWFDLFVTDLGITSANLWRTDILRLIGGFDEDLKSSQEYELMFRYLQVADHVLYDRTPLTVIQERSSGSVSKSDPPRKWHRYVDLRRRILDYLRGSQPDFYFTKEGELKAAFISMLHKLYVYNAPLAIQYYDEIIGRDFRIPATSRLTVRYKVIYNILGFQLTGQLRRISNRRPV